MLVCMCVCTQDAGFREHVERFAEDEAVFFAEYAAAHVQMSEVGRERKRGGYWRGRGEGEIERQCAHTSEIVESEWREVEAENREKRSKGGREGGRVGGQPCDLDPQALRPAIVAFYHSCLLFAP